MVILTDKFFKNVPSDSYIVITKYKERWFITIKNNSMRRVHAVSNHENLQKCVEELEITDMALGSVKIIEESIDEDKSIDEKLKKVLRKMWEEVKKE